MGPYNIFTGKERIKGEDLINKAIEEGKLPPKNKIKCCICGQDKGIRDYHNEDYSPENILEDAVPICRRCHLRLHINIDKNPENWENYLKEVENGLVLSPMYNENWTEENDSDEIVDFRSGCVKKIKKNHEKFKKILEANSKI